jgi:acid stress-induced BolA-like protein IbaG/YrbA
VDEREIERLIAAGIPDAEVEVHGDGRHFVARVVSDAFAGLTPLRQHKLVYAALGASFEGALHALSIQTYTREAWERARKLQLR